MLSSTKFAWSIVKCLDPSDLRINFSENYKSLLILPKTPHRSKIVLEGPFIPNKEQMHLLTKNLQLDNEKFVNTGF